MSDNLSTSGGGESCAGGKRQARQTEFGDNTVIRVKTIMRNKTVITVQIP